MLLHLIFEVMTGNRSIDIVIPSYRLDESFLSPIIQLPHPPGWAVSIYIVADNPAADVPGRLQQWAQEGRIQLFINSRNEGPGQTRNYGIRAGKGKWIILLDDDVKPQEDLLHTYVQAIENNPEAIGFVGVTEFPSPVNAATLALKLNGSITHFDMARYRPSMLWAPTANLVLNRDKLDPALFDPSLKKSGEDIEFLVRNSFRSGQPYISVPGAVVKHPWWDNGAVQTNRLFRYGGGGSEVAAKPVIRPYTYRDFSNTPETLLLLLLILPFALAGNFAYVIAIVAVSVVLAEFITNWLKAIIRGKTWSLAVAFQLMWLKNVYETGYLYCSLAESRLSGFMERTDLGFVKRHPGPFRLNRWKIIKMLIILVLLLTAMLVCRLSS